MQCEKKMGNLENRFKEKYGVSGFHKNIEINWKAVVYSKTSILGYLYQIKAANHSLISDDLHIFENPYSCHSR